MPAVARGTGGIAMVGRSLMRLLDGKRREELIDYRVFSIHGPQDDAEQRRLDEWAGDRLRHFGGRRGAFSAAVLWQMATWADLVIFTHLGPASLLALLPRRARPESIVWLHGVEAWVPLPRRRRLGLAGCGRILANTRFTAQKARLANPWIPPAQCCHLGLAAEEAREPVDLEAELGFLPRPRDLVIVGRMVKSEGHKGHRELISAMGDVVQAVPDARLIVVGAGDNLPYYRELAGQTGVADHVLFTGYLPDRVLSELYRRVGLFAMPSRQEGFGLVYLEAMRAGLPCVASNCDAAGEVVVDGETGYLVDPGDQKALATAIQRLLLDRELSREFGIQGRRRFCEQFTERHFHQRFWQALVAALPSEPTARDNAGGFPVSTGSRPAAECHKTLPS
jgi:phosphatidylinositol alpha-1,6-mannosyltransferase